MIIKSSIWSSLQFCEIIKCRVLWHCGKVAILIGSFAPPLSRPWCFNCERGLQYKCAVRFPSRADGTLTGQLGKWQCKKGKKIWTFFSKGNKRCGTVTDPGQRCDDWIGKRPVFVSKSRSPYEVITFPIKSRKKRLVFWLSVGFEFYFEIFSSSNYWPTLSQNDNNEDLLRESVRKKKAIKYQFELPNSYVTIAIHFRSY